MQHVAYVSNYISLVKSFSTYYQKFKVMSIPYACMHAYWVVLRQQFSLQIITWINGDDDARETITIQYHLIRAAT